MDCLGVDNGQPPSGGCELKHAGAKVWQELYGYERDLLKEVMGMIWTR